MPFFISFTIKRRITSFFVNRSASCQVCAFVCPTISRRLFSTGKNVKLPRDLLLACPIRILTTNSAVGGKHGGNKLSV